MPCKCRASIKEYPDTVDWGPILWGMLHGLAEKLGKGYIYADEMIQWKKIIPLTADIIPCDICRDHYKEYLKANPINAFLKLPKTESPLWIQRWFFTLHNEVNVGNDKPIYKFEDLAAAYGSIDFLDMLHRLIPLMNKSIEANQVGLVKWRTWMGIYKAMIVMY